MYTLSFSNDFVYEIQRDDVVWYLSALTTMIVTIIFVTTSSFGPHKKATTFNDVGTNTTRRNLKNPMAIRLQESDMVISGCVQSHEIPEKTHHLLVFQACQAKLGVTKRVCGGSITLDDYGAQALEVAQQVGTGFMIRIDLLIPDDDVRNPLLSDLVIDLGD